MQYTTLGNVSRLAFGAMTFTAGNKDIAAIYKVDEKQADTLVGQALDAGVTLFDTADAYAGGESETLLAARCDHGATTWPSPPRSVSARARHSPRRGCRAGISCGRSIGA